MKTHFPYIVLVVIGILTLLTFFSIFNINFNPPENEVVQKVVTVDTQL